MSGSSQLQVEVSKNPRVVPGNTSVSWQGGTPISTGADQAYAWELTSLYGSSVLNVTAPAPSGSDTYELDVYWAPGMVTLGMAVAAAGNATITNNITTVTKTTYTYRDGALQLSYTPQEVSGSNCLPDLCVAKTDQDNTTTVMLSRPGVVDWVRAGGLGITNGTEPNAQAPWFLESKADGPSSLLPHLVPENADLIKFESSTPTFQWEDGQPDAAAANATGGVY